MRYDRSHTEDFYDTLAEREWERFARNAATRVSLAVHTHYLRQYVRAGNEVLDIGAGPGRFTIEMARLGANVTVADISRVQLALNKQKVTEAGFEPSVRKRVVCDIVDLAPFSDGNFDVTVAYGGPLSYALDRIDDAIRECLRVTTRGGYLVFSVMSRIGSLRNFFPQVVELTDHFGFGALADPYYTGLLDERYSATGHRCRMFSASEIKEILRHHSCEVVAMSASNFLAYAGETVLDQRWDDLEVWNRFLEIELEACREPGALDGGTHLIAVVKKA